MHKAMNWSLVAQRTICSATQFAGDMVVDMMSKMVRYCTRRSSARICALHGAPDDIISDREF